MTIDRIEQSRFSTADRAANPHEFLLLYGQFEFVEHSPQCLVLLFLGSLFIRRQRLGFSGSSILTVSLIRRWRL